MLDFDTAQKLITEKAACTSATEHADLYKLNNRVLAQDIIAEHDVPPANNSAMDGYAVRYQDANQPGATMPLQSPVYAGQLPDTLKPGHAMRIFTGSILPAGADTIVIQENCTATDSHVIINSQINSGDFVRYRGEDMASGKTIIQAGTRLKAGHIGILAAQGLTGASVFTMPKIGILTTGDEIIKPGAKLPAAAIYDSNTAMLVSLCQNLGIYDLAIQHANDDLVAITKAINQLSKDCDLILTVGGVSVGDKDFIKPALAKLGCELDLWRVQMKPGKPVALAQLGPCTLIGLPGNPVSSFVVFVLLASPFIRKLQGETQALRPIKKARISLGQPINNGSRTDFIRVKTDYRQGNMAIIKPYHQQSSGAVSSLGWADGLARLPVNSTINDGDVLDWYEFAEHLA